MSEEDISVDHIGTESTGTDVVDLEFDDKGIPVAPGRNYVINFILFPLLVLMGSPNQPNARTRERKSRQTTIGVEQVSIVGPTIILKNWAKILRCLIRIRKHIWVLMY
ncbi:PREDICTED: uncharacterized protein LOC105952679 [Erythranthe guttata]|uniref:uncharacterized protein LOC105952679 n=1 Tax=Erythranthe guttata TaxID=4155 RepID=UPI00064DE93E|nr:PREDICTED: uncharacterized protein LOC105952679 [Erythranthe guttata]|eukprot:XP_012831713.1 PREDICTED: uncharacterized protein LOC105952679 [Erythranthe guttata]